MRRSRYGGTRGAGSRHVLSNSSTSRPFVRFRAPTSRASPKGRSRSRASDESRPGHVPPSRRSTNIDSRSHTSGRPGGPGVASRRYANTASQSWTSTRSTGSSLHESRASSNTDRSSDASHAPSVGPSARSNAKRSQFRQRRRRPSGSVPLSHRNDGDEGVPGTTHWAFSPWKRTPPRRVDPASWQSSSSPSQTAYRRPLSCRPAGSLGVLGGVFLSLRAGLGWRSRDSSSCPRPTRDVPPLCKGLSGSHVTGEGTDENGTAEGILVPLWGTRRRGVPTEKEKSTLPPEEVDRLDPDLESY